jgi:integrase
MASLRRRDGTYYLQWYVGPQQHRVSLHTTSRAVALAKKREFEQRQNDDLTWRPTRTNLVDAIRGYLDFVKRTQRPDSVLRDRYVMRGAFGPICSELRIKSKHARKHLRQRNLGEGPIYRIIAPHVEAISPAAIGQFLGEVARDRNLSPRTVNRFRETLCCFFRWCLRSGGCRMPGNPVHQVAKWKEPAPVITFLSKRDIERQLDAVREQPLMYAMVGTYIFAGLRREEAFWLTVDDVDFSAGPRGVLRIRAKVIEGERWQPKTARERIVPLSRRLREILDGYQRPNRPRPWYFPSPDGYRWRGSNFAFSLRAFNRYAGLPWSCYHFRHTFGSQLAARGESLFKISQLMGNSPEICRRHYASLHPESLHDAVEF